MRYPNRESSLYQFLQSQKDRHNNPAILDCYEPGMECQVNVSRGNGEPVDDRRNTYTDGEFTWYNFRVGDANNAKKVLTYPLDLYAHEIGLSGWCWQKKRSLWVGFDFDSLTSHAPGIGITNEELARVREAASVIPWIETRRSTSGSGLHLVAHFDDAGVPTQDHNEHAALARCVLGMMSTIVGFDLAANIDCCGRILWLWSRRATAENEGFAGLKPATVTLSESDLPLNWHDHVDVVTHRRSKVRIRGVTDEHHDSFDSLTSAFVRTPLDNTHHAVIEELSKSGFSTIWVPDHHLLQAHTVALKNLICAPDKQKSMGLVGVFDTLSRGANPGEPNCFMVPMPKGAWRVFRFSPGVKESPLWTQDGKDWTKCDFNKKPNLAIAARAMGGVEDADKPGFVFDTADKALGAAKLLGQEITLPKKMMEREARLKSHKDGRLIVQVQKRDGDGKVDDWLAKKDHMTRVFDAPTEPEKEQPKSEFDGFVRTLITPAGEHAGYMAFSDDGTWDRQTMTNARMRLQTLGIRKNEAESILGAAVAGRWTLVNVPFQPEFLGGRQWNLNAPQFRFQPEQLADDKVPRHPHWDQILQHIGADLDASVKDMEWCQRNDITIGAEWLTLLIACILRDPFEPTPYLFLWGPEDSGKSILHEAIGLLVTKGVVSADRALTNQNGFNGELAGAILAVVEEVDLSQSPYARNRMKELVTCRWLPIRQMRTDLYQLRSTLHFLQCANNLNHGPLWPGDSRVTVCHVPALKKEDMIPKKALLKLLEEEAPHFMATIMGLRLPEPDSRLRIPVVETPEKIELGNQNAPIALFVEKECLLNRGAKIAKCDLYAHYEKWCREHGYEVEGRIRFGNQVIEFSAGAVRPKGKADSPHDGRRHDAYQGICLAQAV